MPVGSELAVPRGLWASVARSDVDTVQVAGGGAHTGRAWVSRWALAPWHGGWH